MKKRLFSCFTVLLLLLACSAFAENSGGAPAWQAYNGKRIGVLTGPLMEGIAHENFPDSEYLLFNSYPDCITALLAGRIDAYLGDEPGLKSVHAEQPKIDYIHERITNQEYSFAFRKNDEKSAALCAELNAFLALCHQDGTMQELDDIWFGVDEERKVVDMSDLTGENGTIKVVTTSTDMPFSYIKDGKNVGYDIDLVVRFCRHAGYKLELGDVDFAARIPAIQSGKYDFTTDMNVTEERKEQVLFSDPTSSGGVVLAILTENSPAEVTNTQADQEKQPITSLSMLAQPGVNIAVGLDTPAEGALARDYPDAKIIPYTDIVLAYMDVANGRMDACVSARTEMAFAIQNGFTGVRLLDENYFSTKIAVGISPVSPIPDLKGKLNAFIAEAKADGTLSDMYDRWVTRGEDTLPDIPKAENPSLTLRVGTTGSVMPYSYYVGTELAGYDIELAHRFASWLGAELEFKVYDFGGIIPAAEAGAIDCIMSNLFYTDEKDEAIPFSDVLFEVEITAMVRDDGQGEPSVPEGGFNSLSQLNGKRIGVQTGQTFDAMIAARLPEATLVYYNNKADLINALTTGKIVSFAADEPVAKVQMQENDRLTYVPEYLDSFEFGYVFAKNEEGAKLRGQMNGYLQTIQADGTLAEIDRRWFSLDDADKVLPDYKSFPAPNGILRLATEALYEPFTYIKNNEIVGYDIDIIVRFCEAYGYGLEIEDMNFAGILPSVQSGKSDVGAAGITITAERAESVYFSDPNYSGGTVMMVLKAETPSTSPANSTVQEESFWDGLKSSFNKTFIRENRWKLFLEGIGTTMLITLLSILFGTGLGFLVFMLCRNGNILANGVTRFSVWLVTGTPMVVLLMILYYVIFGSVAISGIAVAVIGFTLTFGAAVFGLLKMGVGTIDRGQYEAAYALGHSNRHTFFKIILPQAIPHVLPAYQGEIVGLIKATAIVGYIAVQDLTKMGDIVRRRTYEAFFPLIAITVIYFVLEGLFSIAVSRIRVSIDPKKRKREKILKGVNIHD